VAAFPSGAFFAFPRSDNHADVIWIADFLPDPKRMRLSARD
jgi:hypothetical protein